MSHRVIADHLRAVSFLIADGVMPSNEGRGYVLRRIMRRAVRHAHIMGCEQPLLYRLVPALTGEMGQAYPELIRARALITETLRMEETRFRATLARGLRLLAEETAKLGSGRALPGEVAFRLYDTFGFPLDLTQDALRAEGRTVDVAGFDAAMARQRADARKAWSGSGEAATESVWFEVRERAGATEFLGYETEGAEGRIAAIVVDGKEVPALAAGQDAAIVTNQTPFYGESGGQMGDTGALFTKDGAEFAVTDTAKRLGDVHVHLGTLARGSLKVGDVVEMRVDKARRVAPARQPFRHPPAARGAAPPPRRARHPEGLAGGARPAALRHLPSQGPDARRDPHGRGRRQRPGARQYRCVDAPDDPRRGGRRRRHGAVRREVRRRGARRRHGR